VRVVFVGRDRKVWRLLVAHVLTFGIARRVWLHRVNREIDGHDALGLRPAWTVVLLCLPVLGPLVVTFQTAARTRRMLLGSGIRYGPSGWVAATTLLWPLGNFFFIPWEQTRLNTFWARERAQGATHGVEVDLDLTSDPGFVVEMGQALKESYHAGSRFDARKRARQERWGQRAAHWRTVRDERQAVREAGGSTPVLPWKRPERPVVRTLHVTCGRCATAFDVRRDPTQDTPLVCPKCGQTEVLPSLHSDPLRPPRPARLPEVKATCPRCATTFYALRAASGPTPLKCPSCGLEELLPAADDAGTDPPKAAPKATAAGRRRARSG